MNRRRAGTPALATLLLLALLAPACRPPAEDRAAETVAADGEGMASSAAGAADGEPRFFDVTAAAGVDWTHENGAFGERWLPETMGPGVVIFDADGDDRLDLLFVDGRNFDGHPGDASPPALYLNQGDLRFTDAGASSGLAPGYCLGGTAGDIDNDGDADLYLTCVGRDRLYRNDGGRFTDISDRAGLVRSHEFGSGAVFFDADSDGWLDLYAARYVVWTPETDLPCSLYGEGKSYCTPSIYPGASGRFYRNRGDGTFEERTREAGLWEEDAKALGAIAADVDRDGRPDLLVACDTVRNLLFHNRGDGTFEEVGLEAGIALTVDGRARGGMGIAAADFAAAGRPGVAITYFADEMVGLYDNLGDLLFFDRAPQLELGRRTLATLGWGILFFDFDLDGRLDLLVANGHLDSKVDDLPGDVSWAQPQQLFAQRQGGTFVEVTGTVGGDLARPLVGRGAAFGDLDGDGDLDLAITTNGGPARLFENRGPSGHWLRVDLEGRRSNRDGLGALVTVRVDGRSQSWELHSGGSYLSQSQTSPTFGLGASMRVDEIEVRWPSGALQRMTDVAVDRRLTLTEPAEAAP